MSLVLGIDPGAHGAFAVYDTDSGRIIDVKDMPTWFQQVSRTKRLRVDPIGLAEIMDTYRMMGVTLAVMEAVGGRGKQPGSAGFVFGYAVGMVYMSMIYNSFAIETVIPATWKKLMNVPGKQKADDTAIAQRAEEIFPHDRAFFRGERGGKKIDRCEAAMLAKFGADFVLKTLQQPTGDLLVDMAYHNRDADTGA